MTKVIKPRCPSCGKVFLGALDGMAEHKCHGCGLEFTIDTKSEYNSHKLEVLEQKLDNG